MSRIQGVGSCLMVCAALAACGDSRPGLLGGYPSASDTPASVDAAAPQDVALLMQPDAAATALDAAVAGPDAAAPLAEAPALDAGSPLDAAAQLDAAVSSAAAADASMMAPPTMPLGEPDYIAIATDPVEPLRVGVDKYVCVFTDFRPDEELWVTAIEVVPQHADYAFRGTVSVSSAQACDELGLDGENVFSYFPSHHRLELRQGDALRIPAGSFLTVQFHYNGLQAKAPSTDSQLTQVRLWTLPKGERPKYEVTRALYHMFNISIPVGAVDEPFSTSMEIAARYTDAGAEIIGVGPSTHYLAQRVRASVVAPDGTETTIIDRSGWSIDARKDYLLDPGEYIPIQIGAVHKHSCYYSNRLEDQPLDADGNPMMPQLTTFGLEARNEQCRMNVIYRRPI